MHVGLGRDNGNGPKQHQIVWALGELLFLFFRFFFNTNKIFTVSIGFNNEISDGLGRVNENGPKQRVWRRLGHR